MYCLTHELFFPDSQQTNEDGILALGGDLSLERLKLAYAKGIFPWYSEGLPIIWHCPPKRMVLFPTELRIAKSLRQILRSQRFRISFNQAFEKVISNCKDIDRSKQGEDGTWITNAMQQAYIGLFKDGVAHSVEIWEDDKLVGGLYGVAVGRVFCGESMFSKVSNASKIALVALVQSDHYDLIDCQVYNEHLASLGAKEIPRADFLLHLA